MLLFADIMDVVPQWNQSIGLIDNWIRHIKDVYRLHEHYLNTR
jgi:hypothetical protein